MRLIPTLWIGLALSSASPVLAGSPAETLALRPCAKPELWPHSVRSARLPLQVHYQKSNQASVAQAVLGHLERFWRLEVQQLGFRGPGSDGGACGPDGDFDVWLWRGYEQAYVTSVDDEPSTPRTDARVTMVLDPWGPFGREFLISTLAHELNHAMQARDDWWEHGAIFEMTSQFVEWLAAGNDEVYLDVLGDFQARPDWSVDYFDGYRTYFMYGAALYLHFLRDRHFDGDARFLAEMWRRCRNPEGPNEPDFEDALDQILARLPEPTSFLGTIPEFARWRWYTGPRQDGRHFRGGLKMPPVAVAADLTLGQGSQTVDVAPMLLGSAYMVLHRGEAGPENVSILLSPPATDGVEWVLQAMPGLEPGSDGEVLELSAGSATLALPAGGQRALVLTAIGTADPDDRASRPDQRYPVRLLIQPSPAASAH